MRMATCPFRVRAWERARKLRAIMDVGRGRGKRRK